MTDADPMSGPGVGPALQDRRKMEENPVKQITLPATVDSIPAVTAFIDAELEEIGCPMPVQFKIDIALDEIFGNIAHYAYAPGTGEATVEFEFDEETRTVFITLTDAGRPYNPTESADPDVSLSAEERKVGGLRIYLVKKTMDGIRYRYENQHNVLTLIKKI